MKVEAGSFVCMGCGLEHDCGTKGCRILREAAGLIEQLERELEKEKERVSWAMEKLFRATGQLKAQEDACPTCAHGKSPLPCTGDPDPVGLCDTCQKDCVCKNCEDHSKWVWDGGGTK
jgi:hypothetical protein